jgi:glutathione S-transferase
MRPARRRGFVQTKAAGHDAIESMTTIYQLKHSPFCIPIVAIFRALGEPLREKNVPNHDRSEIITLTKGAYYQVPVLVDGNAAVFESSPDSQDVARYVDRKFAGGRLFPGWADGLQSIVIAHLENDVEGVTFKLTDPKYLDDIKSLTERVMIIRHKERKFGRGCVGQWRRDAAELRVQAKKVLAPYDHTFRHSPFLFGGQPVYADYLLLGIIGNLTFRGYNTIPAGLGALSAWEKRIRAFRF